MSLLLPILLVDMSQLGIEGVDLEELEREKGEGEGGGGREGEGGKGGREREGEGREGGMKGRMRTMLPSHPGPVLFSYLCNLCFLGRYLLLQY